MVCTLTMERAVRPSILFDVLWECVRAGEGEGKAGQAGSQAKSKGAEEDSGGSDRVGTRG